MKINNETRERILQQIKDREKEWDEYAKAEVRRLGCLECADRCQILEECKKGNHQLVTIYRNHVGCDEYQIVRWCRVCGCIVVDGEYDGRVYPGKLMKMEAPRIYQI